MPQLQLHQYRVAAVANMICDNFEGQIDKKAVISAALLHDMGNIVKFNLPLYPEYLAPKGLDYWENVKKKFIDKYGSDEHVVTQKIVKEINVSEKVRKIIHSYGYSKNIENSEHNDFEIKIAVYGDFRVAIYGVASLEDRIEDAYKRLRARGADMSQSKVLHKHARVIEDQIFDKCSITAGDITDDSIANYISPLKNFKL